MTKADMDRIRSRDTAILEVVAGLFRALDERGIFPLSATEAALDGLIDKANDSECRWSEPYRDEVEDAVTAFLISLRELASRPAPDRKVGPEVPTGEVIAD